MFTIEKLQSADRPLLIGFVRSMNVPSRDEQISTLSYAGTPYVLPETNA